MEKIKEFIINLWRQFIEILEESLKYKPVIIGVKINETDKKIKIKNKVYSYDDIVDCELIEDGNSVIKASLLGTAAKGFAFGLAGYFSKAKTEKKYCTRLQVKITVNNVSNPCIFFDFIKKKTKKDSKDYEKAFNQSQKCLSMFKVIMEQK